MSIASNGDMQAEVSSNTNWKSPVANAIEDLIQNPTLVYAVKSTDVISSNATIPVVNPAAKTNFTDAIPIFFSSLSIETVTFVEATHISSQSSITLGSTTDDIT